MHVQVKKHLVAFGLKSGGWALQQHWMTSMSVLYIAKYKHIHILTTGAIKKSQQLHFWCFFFFFLSWSPAQNKKM